MPKGKSEKKKNSQKREPISKSLRFEVFKRDRFTCQYCGRKAPDIILEVDHIDPVSNGGQNDILNLITSCFDCNRGKGKTPISKNKAMDLKRDSLEALAIKKEQLEMMMAWERELSELTDMEIQICVEKISSYYDDWAVNQSGKASLRDLIRRFKFDSVYKAIEIAFSQYFIQGYGCSYMRPEERWEYAFNKIGGICYNQNKGK